MRRTGLVMIGILGACGGEASERPTRADCIKAVAHEWMLVDLAAATGAGELAAEIGADLVGKPFENDEQALAVIRNSEVASGQPGEGERRVARCLADHSRARVACVLRAPTAAAVGRCPP